MRKRKVSVFVYLNLDKIEKMRLEGWTLHTIYEDLKVEFGEDFSFNTFATSFQRARKKYNQGNQNQMPKTHKNPKLNTTNTKIEDNIINTFSTARAIKNSDPWED